MPRHAAPRSGSPLADLVAASSPAQVSELLLQFADLDSGPLQDLLDVMCAAAVATGSRRLAWDTCFAASQAVQDLSARIGEAAAALAALPAYEPGAAGG